MARTIAKDHDQKRAQILKSAARVFAREGYDGASMTQLAHECGISKANIYHYYNGKEAILFDILETHLCELRDQICRIEVEGLSPADQLHKVFAETLLAYQGMDDEHRVQTSVISALSDEQQSILRGYQREMVAFLSRLIEGIAPEVFEGNADKLRSTTMSVFGMLNWYYMWNSGAGSKAREDYAMLVSKLTLHGVKGL